MKPKTILKMVVDIFMTVALLILMTYELVGAGTHEWVGVTMFTLVIIHLVLNRKWIRGLSKGKYNAYRIFQTALTTLIFSCMAGLMVSGIIMSNYVFKFLNISGGQSFARVLHMLCAYWAFVLMSLHLGLHAHMIMGMMSKTILKKINLAKLGKVILRVVAILITVYGIYAFATREIGSYMLLESQFVFFNFDEPLIFFFTDYFSIMFLFVFIGYYLEKGFRMAKNRKQGQIK